MKAVTTTVYSDTVL